MHDAGTGAIGTARGTDYESAHAVSFVDLNALLRRRYMHEDGVEREDFAPFSINSHRNAARNPPTPERGVDQRHAGVGGDPAMRAQRNAHVTNQLTRVSEGADRVKPSTSQQLAHHHLAIEGWIDVSFVVAAPD